MTKIKSTLDLVMERTKNLNMTDADKEKLRQKEGKDKVRSWLKRYLDGKINADEVRRNLDANSKAFPAVTDILKNELVSSIKPEGDNEKILHVLARVFDTSSDLLEEIMASYDAQLGQEMPRYAEQLGSDLKGQGIHGTAVVPNISQNRQWKDFVLNAQMDLKRRITAVIDSRTSNL